MNNIINIITNVIGISGLLMFYFGMGVLIGKIMLDCGLRDVIKKLKTRSSHKSQKPKE